MIRVRMAHVHFTPHLRSFFDLPESYEVPAPTVRALVESLEKRWPGIAFYITDERGRLRQHVAIWVDGKQVRDREHLGEALEDDSVVHILQALSGG